MCSCVKVVAPLTMDRKRDRTAPLKIQGMIFSVIFRYVQMYLQFEGDYKISIR